MGRGLRKGDLILSFLLLIVVEEFNLLMRKVVELGRFFGFKFNRGEEHFSNLQYADDTLLIDKKGWANISTIKTNLMLFKIMLGLKVNFNKILLDGINIYQHWLEEATNILNFKIGSSTFIYLGLPIGDNSRRKVIWQSIYNCCEF